MAEENTLHEDIREMRQALTTLVAGQARTEQKIDGLNDRLYGTNGSIPALWAAHAQDKASVDVVEKEVGVVKASVVDVNKKVDGQRLYVLGIGTGVSLAINGLKLGLAKLLHF